jgi:hypothetical protein
MTRNAHRSSVARFALTIVSVAVLWVAPAAVFAADNQATGDIAGDGSDLNDSNVFTLNTTTLALVKTAFLTDGTQLTSGDDVARGTPVQFMVHVDNPTDVPVIDLNLLDVLDPAFVYQATTIKVDNSVASGSPPAAIYAAVNAAATLDDAVDGVDVAGISGATISAGSGAGNAQLDVAANRVWAIIFTVEVQ